MQLRHELPLNPGERSVLTANRVNVRNRKCKKELASKQKGFEDAMKFDNVLLTRESAIMLNRLSRLALVNDGSGRCSSRIAPLLSASPTAIGNANSEDIRRLSSRGSSIPTSSRLPSQENRTNYSPLSSIDVQFENSVDSERRPPTEDRLRRHVHFLSERATSSGPGSDYNRTRRRSEPAFFRNKDNPLDLRNEFATSSLPALQFHGISSESTRNEDESARSHLIEDREMRRGRSNSMFVGNMRGFSNTSSQTSGLTPRNSLKALSGLEEELVRYRRLHHTRAVNARIKAVRSGGKRHSTCATLRERMDQEAMLRKEQALSPQPFTAARAWSLLNCGYLRLTPNNVATLEEICSREGYDISAHPHKPASADTINTDVVFKDLRDNRLSRSDLLRSQLQFRQSVLMRRFSEGFNTLH